MALALGCAPRFDWSGKWVGERPFQDTPKGNPVIAKTIARVELEFQRGGKFVLVEGGVPKAGTATFAGKIARLKVETYMDRPIRRLGEGAEKMNQEILVEALGPDSIRLTDPAGFDPEPLVLSRKRD